MWSIVYYEMKVRKLLSISGCRSWHGKDHYTPKTPCIPCSCSRRGSWRSRSSCCRRRSQRRIFPGSPRIFWGKHNDIPTYFSDLQCLSVCLSSYLIRISNNLFSSNRIIFWVSNLHFQFQLGPDIFESPEDNGASGGRTEQDNQDNNAGGTAELNLEV